MGFTHHLSRVMHGLPTVDSKELIEAKRYKPSDVVYDTLGGYDLAMSDQHSCDPDFAGNFSSNELSEKVGKLLRDQYGITR